VAESSLTRKAQQALASGQIDGVLHYSRRSAELFVAAAQSAGLTEKALACGHYCLSPDVAAPLRQAGASHLRIAEKPDEMSLLALLGAR
jgi:uroporphyrinogen-III synthase